jgi:F0F1-type ATP synthase membrane subunit b/b'
LIKEVHMKYTMKYLKAKRMMHIIDKRLNEIEKRLIRAKHLRVA